MQKAFKDVTKKAAEGISRGKTAFPSGQQLQKQLGVRYDYDGEVQKDGVEFHKFNVQPNAGNDIPSSVKR
ncbi:hypothetical protein LTR86_003016 [Recurvomyces mirabilis]|nr:hypothetical protein LTR86_003016 [Recurvomyces mirabilis]